MKNKLLISGLVAAFTLPASATIHTIGGSSQQLDLGDYGGLVTVPGSNFTMFTPTGAVLINPDAPNFPSGTTDDVTGTFDDSKICFEENCTTTGAMNFSSAINFSGSPWSAHSIRVFGPGVYTFETCIAPSTECTAPTPGTLTVGPGQLGAQVLFNWSGNEDIDVLLLWQPNSTFTRPGNTTFPLPLPADTRTYELASRDVDGDGSPGYRMSDGPFNGHNASFSLFLDTPVAIPPRPALAITQASNAGASTGTIDTSGAIVTIDSGVTAGGNTPNLSYDWNVIGDAVYDETDSTLITANTNGTTSSTFEFDPTNPALLPGSTVRLSVKITNTDNGLSHGAAVNLLMGCPADDAAPGADTDGDGIDDLTERCADSDGDGILEYLDPASLTAQQISTVLSTGGVATVQSGVIGLGEIAKLTNNASGIGITATDIGTTDNDNEVSCVGGCFDFTITDGALSGGGSAATIVLPLTTAIPERASYRKYTNGVWVDYATDDFNKVDSAPSSGGSCPSPGDPAYDSTGLVVGNDCLQLTIEDNGPNDTDTANGKIADPSGVAQAPVPPAPAELKVSGVGSLGLGAFITGLFGITGLRRLHKAR